MSATTPTENLSDHPLSPEKPVEIPDFSLEPAQKTQKLSVETMSQAELLDLRVKIDARLTGVRLSEVNLEKETLIQFQHAKMLQIKANESKDTPMNQRAQVQNSLANLLQQLGKMQMELHDSESLKRLRAATIKVVKEQSKEFQDRFFELLELEFEKTEAELSS